MGFDVEELAAIPQRDICLTPCQRDPAWKRRGFLRLRDNNQLSKARSKYVLKSEQQIQRSHFSALSVNASAIFKVYC